MSAASTNAAQLAHKNTNKKSTDDACWVQAEKMAGFEITCVAARLVWNEPLIEKVDKIVVKEDKFQTPWQAEKPKAAAEFEALASDATLKERAAKRARTLLTSGPGDALGPQLPGEDAPVERTKLEGPE